jgi:hypothetical protein
MTTDASLFDFIEVAKLPVPVAVEFSQCDGIIETLEGQVQYKSGDPILTGVKGERWPVQRNNFFTHYTPAPPHAVWP